MVSVGGSWDGVDEVGGRGWGGRASMVAGRLFRGESGCGVDEEGGVAEGKLRKGEAMASAEVKVSGWLGGVEPGHVRGEATTRESMGEEERGDGGVGISMKPMVK